MATLIMPRHELTETAERFLNSILEKLALERITELHLFEPMRQSGVETGIAVVAYDEVPTDAPDEVAERRHTVFTARYRAVLKGPERGKWETELVNEAEAPLVTVETVVRGVQRRSGDEFPPVCLDAAQLAAALRRPLPVAHVGVDPDAVEPLLDDIAVAEGFTPAPLADLPPTDDPQWSPA
jgi:hypothetical protein